MMASFLHYGKNAKVFSLYKGKGNVSDAGFYRSISLCSFFGKHLETIFKKHLVSYVSENQLLSCARHCFIEDRSIVTNCYKHALHSSPTLSQGRQHMTSSVLILRRLSIAPHVKPLSALYLCRCIEICYTGLKVFSPVKDSVSLWTTKARRLFLWSRNSFKARL